MESRCARTFFVRKPMAHIPLLCCVHRMARITRRATPCVMQCGLRGRVTLLCYKTCAGDLLPKARWDFHPMTATMDMTQLNGLPSFRVPMAMSECSAHH